MFLHVFQSPNIPCDQPLLRAVRNETFNFHRVVLSDLIQRFGYLVIAFGGSRARVEAVRVGPPREISELDPLTI